MTTLAERIRTSRKMAGLSQVDLAKSLRVSASAVNQWENGLSKNIKLEYFFALASVLQQDPQWLATGTVFPQRHCTQNTPPPGSQPKIKMSREEKALLHHFRRLPERMRKQLLKFIRAMSGLPVFEVEPE